MIEVTLYSREECHLCEQARMDLEDLKKKFTLKLTVVDVDQDPKLKKEYGLQVPVIAVGPFRLKAPFSAQDLEITLAAAQDRERHIAMVEASPKLQEIREQGIWSRADGFSRWFSNHYMLIFNLAVLLYLGGALLAPVLMKLNISYPANLIYKGYSLVCHQLGFRSFYVFGEQAIYPRSAAGVAGVFTFSQATGLSESSSAADLLKARSYVGNEQVGYKLALCERDIAIYAGILLFGLLFSLSRYRFVPLPWYLWILIGVVPIAIDGFSQLLSQPPLSFWAFRESTPTLRVLTGLLFGFCTAWFGYPVVEESMRDMREVYQKKWQRMQQLISS
jgi:uncharacterized membrane protein